MELDDILVILLAGGVGERLYPLTKDRAKPADPTTRRHASARRNPQGGRSRNAAQSTGAGRPAGTHPPVGRVSHAVLGRPFVGSRPAVLAGPFAQRCSPWADLGRMESRRSTRGSELYPEHECPARMLRRFRRSCAAGAGPSSVAATGMLGVRPNAQEQYDTFAKVLWSFDLPTAARQ